MKTIFIYNKTSGKGKITKYLDYIEKELHKKYDEVDIVAPLTVDDFIKTVEDASINYDSICFGGGDGTFNMVANIIAKMDKRPTLGYIPLGTCNDIARNNNIPLNIKKAVKCIIDSKESYHDVSKINEDYFLYAAAIGTGSACTYVTKQKAKKRLGRLGYLGSIIKEFFKKTIVHATVDSDGIHCEGDYALIYILNTKEVGSFKFNRKAKINTGNVEVVLIKKGKGSGRFNIFRFMIGRLFGIKKLPIESIYTNKVNLKVDGDWNIDGEKGPTGPVKIEVLHNHIKIYTR